MKEVGIHLGRPEVRSRQKFGDIGKFNKIPLPGTHIDRQTHESQAGT